MKITFSVHSLRVLSSDMGDNDETFRDEIQSMSRLRWNLYEITARARGGWL